MIELIFTLGFDEKFQIRSIIRHGVKESARIIVIIAEPMDERVKAAKERLKKFVLDYIPNSEFIEVTINPINFIESVSKLFETFSNLTGEEIIVNLSGGMRALIIETLIGLILSEKKAKIEIELENFQGTIQFDSRILRSIELEKDDIEILNAVRHVKKLIEIVEWVNKPKTTVYRRLEELVEKGLLNKKVEGKSATYEITEIGKLMLKIKKKEQI